MSENLKLPTIQVDFGSVTINTAETITDFIEGKNEMHIYDERATRIREYAFYQFPFGKLRSVEMPNATEIRPRAFEGCYGIISAKFPKVDTVWNNVFTNCGIRDLDIRNATTLYKQAFYKSGARKLEFNGPVYLWEEVFLDSSLKALVLRSPQGYGISRYGERALDNTPIAQGSGFIYVPERLIEKYRTAEGWQQFNFKVLEEYTVDGTDTGEVDWEKIDKE